MSLKRADRLFIIRTLDSIYMTTKQTTYIFGVSIQIIQSDLYRITYEEGDDVIDLMVTIPELAKIWNISEIELHFYGALGVSKLR